MCKPAAAPEPAKEKPKRSAVKNDPKLVAAARELRDRYLEQFNSGRFAAPAGKYDVSRAIGEAARSGGVGVELPEAAPMMLLPAG